MCDVPVATQNADGTISVTKPQLRMPGQVDVESGWSWCRNCQGLFRASHPAVCPSPPPAPLTPRVRPGAPARFPAATRPHNPEGSGQYVLYLKNANDCVQTGWSACVHCSGLFHAPSGSGRCPASPSGHAAGQSYVLQTCEQPGTQGGWRYCHRCGVLHFAGNASSVCPAGGAHDASQSGAYFVPHLSGG